MQDISINELHGEAQKGIALLEYSIIELLKQHPKGLRNSQITQLLGLQSEQNGQNRDYLAWSLLGILMKKGLVVKCSPNYQLATLVHTKD